jgi:putative zinc finger/helix-turn-helix YgiT family protein
MKHSAYCPSCRKTSPIRVESRKETYRVRGQDIEAMYPVSVCEICGLEFSTAEQADAGLKASYEIYRSRNEMLSPDEIVQLRNSYHASQKAFGLILGFGELTINTYEQGSLPAESHQKILALARDPAWFAAQFIKAKEALGPTQCKRVQSALDAIRADTNAAIKKSAYQYERDFSGMVGERESEYSGWTKPLVEKAYALMVAILENVSPPMYKMRLLKLMFYSDFGYFRRSTHSISGWPYARLPYGPVPDQYERLICQAMEAGILISQPDEAEIGEILTKGPSATKELSGLLSPEETETIVSVCREIGALSASELSALTHREDAWLKTKNAARISYHHALSLKALPEA